MHFFFVIIRLLSCSADSEVGILLDLDPVIPDLLLVISVGKMEFCSSSRRQRRTKNPVHALSLSLSLSLTLSLSVGNDAYYLF